MPIVISSGQAPVFAVSLRFALLFMLILLVGHTVGVQLYFVYSMAFIVFQFLYCLSTLFCCLLIFHFSW